MQSRLWSRSRAQNAFLVVRIEIGRDGCGSVAALLVDGAHLASVVDAARGGDDLVVGACPLSHQIALSDAGFDDMAVAFRR